MGITEQTDILKKYLIQFPKSTLNSWLRRQQKALERGNGKKNIDKYSEGSFLLIKISFPITKLQDEHRKVSGLRATYGTRTSHSIIRF